MQYPITKPGTLHVRSAKVLLFFHVYNSLTIFFISTANEHTKRRHMYQQTHRNSPGGFGDDKPQKSENFWGLSFYTKIKLLLWGIAIPYPTAGGSITYITVSLFSNLVTVHHI